jgi:rare lipoprotein A
MTLIKSFLLLLTLILLISCAGSASIGARKGYDRNHKSGTSANTGSSFRGEASFYGPGFAGKKTANGEIFDPEAMTCAHQTLPFGTKLRVTHQGNGKSVEVRVNDRGPFAHNRVLDLSVAAARKLNMEKEGHAEITAEVIE